ncbi:outer spore coat protein CotE [Pullulanibacillus sp. KACC 23026]|uniref:outer spore coat protein CotE n=1 Tax=Pullulanibacillus sp. KACC 23026 TaxID=3028315 RepID=UPI0023B01427|nr:outer spore coat protein CotE [Pullulanibacillus sp. KACC 23026]WEG14842.1 outer spore coat protein CotE [Pullulanibacillus sp. KACC 23026]
MFVDIITKAICGKGKKLSNSLHQVGTQHPISNLLGCWILNHRFKANRDNQSVIVQGTYEIHLWYAYEKDTHTEIAKTSVQYEDQLTVLIQNENLISDELDIHVKFLHQPNCIDTTFKQLGNQVLVKTEHEWLAIIIGETQLKVEAKDSNET